MGEGLCAVHFFKHHSSAIFIPFLQGSGSQLLSHRGKNWTTCKQMCVSLWDSTWEDTGGVCKD